MDAILSWFDLAGGATIRPEGQADVSVWHEALLYGVVIMGVLLARSIAMARAGAEVSVQLSWPWVVTAAAIALVVFPAVWRDIGATPGAPLFVQLGLAAQGGAFWGVLLAGAEKRVMA